LVRTQVIGQVSAEMSSDRAVMAYGASARTSSRIAPG
jgi:hypothetical protein